MAPPNISKPKPRKAPSKRPSTGRTGFFPDAHPTAPGGMSIAAIRTELAEHHGVPMAETRTWGEKFPPFIDALVEARAAYEAEHGEPFGAEPEPEVDEAAETLAGIEMSADELAAEMIERDMTSTVIDEDDDFADLDFDDEDSEPDNRVGLRDNYDKIVLPNGGMVIKQKDETYDASLLRQEVGVMVTTEPGVWVPVITDITAMFDDESEGDFDPENLFSDEVIAAREANKPAPIFVGMPDTYDYIFDGHYGASPSGAERWAHCTASLQASREFLETLTPNQQHAVAQSSTAARQGTTAHAVGEAELLLMLGRISQEEYEYTLLDLTLNPDIDESYDAEMAEHLTEYVDYVRQLHDAGRPLLIEARVRAKVWLTDDHDGEVHEIPGSADCGALPSEDEPNVITVADLKYGNGIDVSVDGNPQVRIYGLGLIAKFIAEGGDIDTLDTIEYVIVQPRLGGIKVAHESIDDLFDWRDEVLAPALTKALYGVAAGATFAPSEQACQWCLARGGCAALIEDRMAAGASMFDAVLEAEVSGNPIDPTLLSNERLGEVLAQITAVADLKDDIKAEVQRRLHRGQDVALHELVNYTPARSWKDGAEERIKEAIANKVIPSIYKPPPLMTPTQALTLLKEQTDAREWVEAQVDVHPVVPVVGPTEERRKARGDKRKSWNGRAPESMFPDDLADAPSTSLDVTAMFPDE